MIGTEEVMANIETMMKEHTENVVNAISDIMNNEVRTFSSGTMTLDVSEEE